MRLVTFFYLYFMQGLPAGFALTALANFLLAEELSAQQVGTFVALVGLPWTVQFIWGPFIDRFQHTAMGSRKPWVVVSQLCACLASLALLLVVNPAQEIYLLSACFFLHSVFASIQDASVDAMAISVTPVAERGRVNACMRGGMLIGSSLGGAVMALCLRSWGFQAAVLMQGLMLLAFTLLTFFIKENEQDALLAFRFVRNDQQATNEQPTLTSIFLKLFTALLSKLSLRTFGVIALVYICLSIFVRSLNVYLIQELHWTDTYLSTLSSSYVVVGATLVMVAGGILSDRMGAGKLLCITIGLIGGFLLLFNLMAPLWNNQAVSSTGLLVWYMFDPSFSIAAMPILMNISQKGIEAAQFTTYMSLVNFSDVVGSYVSGYILSWLSAPTIGILCGLLMLALLFFLLFIARPAIQKTGMTL
ncbi:MFS transporter [Rhodocytophaga aerolata]|uniref:MFS transporter n=1 Tax=Rhodocytophaga aerolata TaxID=455078 RepID=A0ABT8RFK4_9BACT|nr:MFS transporter [Rhodocytophaga aerolata]MDO1450884.1 MFS transporter [Rhodocytophaga aerolata]